jgi:pilus assembly protein Flp/PilA
MNELIQYLQIRLEGRMHSERGASAVEYGLLVALIALAIIVAVTALGTHLSTMFNRTANSIN